MKESYREGVADHPGPEPCEGGREAALEALDRGICRLGMELRNRVFQEADGVGPSEGNTARCEKREHVAGPAESKTPGIPEKLHAREPGDPLPPVAERRRAGGRTR